MKSGLRFALLLLASLLACLASAQDNATFVSRSGATGVYAGADFYATNVMKNSGTTTWTTAAGYAMMSIAPNNNTTWGGNRIPIPGSMPSVAPGAQVTFSKLCTAPITPGTYAMQWQVSKSGTPFGAPTPLINIIVYQGADNAQFISSTAISTSIGPSKQFGAILTMKNLGTATWGSGYSLAPIGSNNFGVASLPSSSTARNASYGFAGAFTAPSTPGTYTFQWRMQHGTVKFGQPTPLLTIVVSNDAAQFVSRSGAVEVYAGTNFYATNTMRNTGTTTWTWNSTPAYWMTILPSTDTTWSASKMNLPTTVAPGATMTTSAYCKAPFTPGTYTMQWQMVKNGTAFGEKTPATTILVDVVPPEAAQFISQSVPTTTTAGQQFVATVTFKNVGSSAWPQNTSLTCTSPLLGYTWGLQSVAAGAVVPAGTSKTFSVDALAPYKPGVYTFQFRLRDMNTNQWFGFASASVSINVVAGAYAESPWPGYRGGRYRGTSRGYGTAATGQLKWSYNMHGMAFGTPALGADGTVYAATQTNGIFAITSAGALKWHFTDGTSVKTFSGPIVAHDGTVYLTTFESDRLYAIDGATGTLKWFFQVGGDIICSPSLGPDGTIYFGSDDHNVYAINQSGVEKWHYATGSRVTSSPIIGPDGTLYVCSLDGSLYALDSSTGAFKWSYATGFGLSDSPTLGADGTIYFGQDYLYAVDTATHVLKWQTANIGWLTWSAVSIGSDGTLFVTPMDSKSIMALDPTTGATKWTYTMGGNIFDMPSIAADGTLYVATQDASLYCFDPITGAKRWSFATGYGIVGCPAIAGDGSLYIPSQDGYLYALK